MNLKKYYGFLANEMRCGSFKEEDIDFLSKHNLYLFFYTFNCLEEADSIKHKAFLIRKKIEYKKCISDLFVISNAFADKGINYLVMKGISIAETYPEPFTRVSGDHDILVRDKDFKSAQLVLNELGYSNPSNISTFKDITLFKENCQKIELHHMLFDKKSENYAAEFEKKIWDFTDVLKIGSNSIAVPSPEMHFRYIVLHLIVHLKAGGAGLRFLLDIKYFSQYHRINLQDQYDYFESVGYGMCYKYCISLCVHYLNTPISGDKAFLINKDDRVLDLFGDYIAESGAFGGACERHRINQYFEQYKQTAPKKSRGSIFKNAFLPSQSVISPFYTYAKKNIFLLPVAWIHRFFRMILRKDLGVREKLFFFTRNDDHIDSINFMKKLLCIEKNKNNPN